ncbi:hypothetical protein BJX62DRAFT_118258 [Aspergillus germanicus]
MGKSPNGKAQTLFVTSRRRSDASHSVLSSLATLTQETIAGSRFRGEESQVSCILFDPCVWHANRSDEFVFLFRELGNTQYVALWRSGGLVISFLGMWTSQKRVCGVYPWSTGQEQDVLVSARNWGEDGVPVSREIRGRFLWRSTYNRIQLHRRRCHTGRMARDTRNILCL